MERQEKVRQRNYRMIALTASIVFHILIIAFLVFGTGGDGDPSMAQEMTNWVSGWSGEETTTQP